MRSNWSGLDFRKCFFKADTWNNITLTFALLLQDDFSSSSTFLILPSHLATDQSAGRPKSGWHRVPVYFLSVNSNLSPPRKARCNGHLDPAVPLSTNSWTNFHKLTGFHIQHTHGLNSIIKDQDHFIIFFQARQPETPYACWFPCPRW